MPFKSKAQQRYMFAQHPQIAKRWAKQTDFSHLPERERRHKKLKKYLEKGAHGG